MVAFKEPLLLKQRMIVDFIHNFLRVFFLFALTLIDIVCY